MGVYRQTKIITVILFLFSVLFINDIEGDQIKSSRPSSLRHLVPQVSSWMLSEAPQHYFPETLFEYIDGAAESYLAYDFQELVVAQYERKDAPASITVELYDMGDEKRAFGIYSEERYPSNNFITLGNGGYLEEGILNFIVGRYYIKLLCFDCGENYEHFLRLFSREVQKNVREKKGIPPLIQKFPRTGLVRNSEKFFLRNFMGYGFLHNGYTARYRLEGYEFDCFIIEGKDVEDARSMFEMYRDRQIQNGREIDEISTGFRIKDPYYQNIFLSRVENFICGVLKIKDGAEKTGEKYLKDLVNALQQ